MGDTDRKSIPSLKNNFFFKLF